MVEYAKKHSEILHIIFDVTDRMTRNDFDKIKIIDLIKLHGKTIHFSRSNKAIDKNSGSEDVFMLDIEVAVAKKMSNDMTFPKSVDVLLRENSRSRFSFFFCFFFSFSLWILWICG